MDRRILKTQKVIIGAFIELLSEKEFEDITISEIADRADVSRGTVYLHYIDKFDLLDKCIDIYFKKLFESCMTLDGTALLLSKTIMIRTFEYLEQHALIYTTLLVNKGIPAFRNLMMNVILGNLSELIDVSSIKQDMNKEVMLQFLASAIVGLLEWWIIQSIPIPAKDIAEQLWSLLERIQVMPHLPDSN
ncbi:TetR/AcrR family transcriptional regulator [Paenibacillus polymyxa]|uniref:TetR/AcrR family transcriptional regulator n=1 Tax=Paenibacillus polymyxa TaxID=1406 RepID=UPI002349A04B|nr:TetR/AcrR family transcriptional regulator [Paenibacillus polymyxa]WCM60036.1 TetR/AcrR family transcriptional regulator [Paenibacillus polymyxa]WCM61374.1 TetR/AcrR family transcriptional regulator [Paenibacillus polymyxa]